MKGQRAWNKNKKCPQWSGNKHSGWKGGKIEKICSTCNEKFYIFPYRKNISKYCSKKCSDLINLLHYGKDNYMWTSGQFKKKAGYVLVLSSNHPFRDCKGYVRRSRLNMEKHIGRYLTRQEVVHHINRIKDDDKIENLMLFPSNFEHILHHIKLSKLNRS